jgi:serine/threonine-protein kinase Chk1
LIFNCAEWTAHKVYSIRKAQSLDRSSQQIFAVKFIHKAYAVNHGRISAKQINMEVSLHYNVGQHPNIIEYFTSGDDPVWRWIAMEFAEGGDLFDKIEADVGVSEDIAHLYFTQLVSGVSYMHSKGIAHRDIKPENILLSATGDLKIADFGLATLFNYKGVRKTSTTMCGSPPYIAPEVINCQKKAQGTQVKAKGSGYSADQADLWSCGVVLFVLLVGNTPWDEPTEASWEFAEYQRENGRSSDELWQRPPRGALSLLRGMMKIDPKTRFTFEEVRRHPWFRRENPLMTSDGRASSPLVLATQMLENLHIDFNQKPPSSQMGHSDAMDIDGGEPAGQFASTQPITPIHDILFDWERPPRVMANEGLSASQPSHVSNIPSIARQNDIWSRLSEEPSMSQFSVTPQVPLTLTQHAQRFQDIMPAYSLTRFFSHLPQNLLITLLCEALHRLGVPVPAQSAAPCYESVAWIKVKTVDGRHCNLNGDIVVDRTGMKGELEGEELLEVRFVKITGDPLEWRRFFKKVVVLCKEGVYVPE